MSCCKIDAIHTGHPRGTMQTINTTSVYITFPADATPTSTPPPPSSSPTPKHPRALLLLSEVHGLLLPNALLLADLFATDLSCPVLVPDLFSADPFPVTKPPGWDGAKEIASFQTRHHPGTVDPLLSTLIAWIHTPSSAGGFGGVRSLGAVGYCFGGRYVLRLLAAGRIAAGVVNHPSFSTIEEVRALAQLAQRPEGADAAPGNAPLAIFAAEDDDLFPPAKRQATEDALREGGTAWWSSTFGGTQHGFSIRGDLSNPAVRFAAETALNGAVRWFELYLKTG